jgi:tight adherence protein B
MRRIAAAICLGVLTASAVGSTAVAEGLVITRTDTTTSADGTASIEFSVPGQSAGAIDPAADITVLENGSPIASTAQQLPSDELEVVMLLDVSGSMREGDAIGAAKAAAIGFLRTIPADARVGVVAFNDQVSLVAPLSTDRQATEEAINRLTANGETALYDAMAFAPTLFSGGTSDRQILLLSDGGDTVSTNTLDQATAVATQIRTSVIELVSSEANADALRQLADANGGTVSSATDPQALDALYAQAAEELVNRYRVSFAPTQAGSVQYTVRVDTGAGTLEASTALEVASVATTTVVTAPPTTVTPPPTVTTIVVDAPSGSTSSGVSSDTLLWIGAAAAFGALFTLLVVALPRRRPRFQTLESLRGSAMQSSGGRKERVVDRATGAAESLMSRGGRTTKVAASLESAGIPLRPGEYAVIAFAGGAVATLVLVALLGPILGVLIGVIITPLAASAYLDSKARSRRNQFSDQLPDTLQMVTTSLRSGFGLPQALDAAADQSPEPMRSELQRALFEVRIGRDIGEAMTATALRMQSADFKWVAAAIQINREVGGELAQVLENVATTIRGRQKLARQVRTLTAEGRISAYVLTGLPPALALFLVATQPDYFEPFRSFTGAVLVVLAFVLLGVGWLWMRALIRSSS